MADTPVQTEMEAATEVMKEFVEFFDVPMYITLEVGRRALKVRDILQLKPESIIEVPKSAGENIDVYVNNRIVAFGEILEMDGKTGIRLTDFVTRT